MKILIGLVGTNGAGKSSVCDHLRSKGFSILSLSDVVRAEARKENLGLDRDNLTRLGSRLKSEFGHDILAKRVFKTAQKEPQKNWVFDSIRHVDELKYLKNHGVYFLGLDAPMKLRYERVILRKGSTDFVDFETFKAQCDREYFGQSSGQNIKETLALCDKVIQNGGSLGELNAKIDQILLDLTP
jgi:dephospho-CoA kinase